MKSKKDKHFIKKAYYEGGPKALKKFIGENLKYPKAALENKIEGTVYVKYTIDHKGNVIDHKVITGVGHGCDQEAVRLVYLLKFVVPKNRGVRIKFHKNIQIHFRLPKEKKIAQPSDESPVPQQVAIQYNYTTTSTTSKKTINKPNKPKKTGSYTITVNFD